MNKRFLFCAGSIAAMTMVLASGVFASSEDISSAVFAQPELATPLQPAEATPAKPEVTPEAKPAAAPAEAAPAQAAPAQAAPTQATAEPSAPVVPPEDAAVAEKLRDLIENKLAQHVTREHDRTGVKAFYANRAFAPLWVRQNAPLPRANAAIAFLRGVGSDGLDPADYPAPRFAYQSPDRLAADELRLTNSVLTFVRHAATGRTAFTRVSGAVYFDLKFPNADDVLAKLAAAKTIGAALDSYNPQHKAYQALKAELATARQSKDARNHADTIVANMERWRWMPHDLGPANVIVNIPDYTLKVDHDGKMVWQTKIVVGKPGTHATPLLTETMKYITVNPTWNVPPSIIRNEYLPALSQDPNALARVGLRVSHNPDGTIRIYQPPGERNALGRIRFNFPNRFLVYQHDTPDKNLFAKATRAYSHGCMRVQNPDQYAEVLLSIAQPDEGYTAKRVRSMYGSGERTITFKTPIPVYVTYQTAFVDEAGKLQIRPDIYGLDKTITALLHQDRRIADVPVARNYSSGSKPVRLPQTAGNNEYDGTLYGHGYGWNRNAVAQPYDRFRTW